MPRRHLRTPNKETNRRLKWSSEQSTTPEKINKKCSDSLFKTGSEDDLLQLAKYSTEISSISEVTDDNQLSDSVEVMQNFVSSSSPAGSSSTSSAAFDHSVSPSTVTFDVSTLPYDINPSASTITSEKVQPNNSAVNCENADLSNVAKRGCSETELVANQFRQADTRSLNSNKMMLVSNTIWEELFKIVIDELHNLPEKRDWFTDIVEKKVLRLLWKVSVVILTFMLMIAFVGVLFFSSADRDFSVTLLPT